jgi:hypothetical protein
MAKKDRFVHIVAVRLPGSRELPNLFAFETEQDARDFGGTVLQRSPKAEVLYGNPKVLRKSTKKRQFAGTK